MRLYRDALEISSESVEPEINSFNAGLAKNNVMAIKIVHRMATILPK